MKRTKNTREAAIGLDFAKIEREIAKQELTPELPLELLEIIRQTGCLLIQRENRVKEATRDKFVASLRQWLSDVASDEGIECLDAHLKQVELCQRAFREIYLTLAASPAGKASPAVSAWSALLATATDVTEVSHAVSDFSPPVIAPNLTYLSSELLRVDALEKPDLDPDATAEAYAYDLGGYLKMLGHLHGWFENDLLRIPSNVIVPGDLRDDRSVLYLAEVWNQLDEHWGRIRYFGNSSVRCEQRSYSSDQGIREVPTLVFEHEWQYFTDIEVARSRLRRQVFEVTVHAIYSPKTAGAVRDPIDHRVELFPRGLISIHEAASMLALDMCYGLPIIRHNAEYLGLTLAEWLRGYALLQFCCERGAALIPSADGLCYLDVGDFLGLAERGGMARKQAQLFLKQATFQKNSRDLFDAPLIRTDDDQYVVLSCIFKHSALHESLTSRINSLLLQVENKGEHFEKEIRDEFEEMGATARRIEYRNAEGDFECDAAVLWDRDLFLIECKAYTLPQPSPSNLFYFRLKQQEAAEQIRRIARHLAQDPSIIAKAFGPGAEVLRATTCVLNLVPFWLAGASEDVKFYDGRALSKFSEGAIKALTLMPGPDYEDESAEDSVVRRLWASETPTPDDLLKQMDQPFQYSTEAKMWSVRDLLVPLSQDLVMLSPILVRRADGPSDLLRITEET